MRFQEGSVAASCLTFCLLFLDGFFTVSLLTQAMEIHIQGNRSPGGVPGHLDLLPGGYREGTQCGPNVLSSEGPVDGPKHRATATGQSQARQRCCSDKSSTAACPGQVTQQCHRIWEGAKQAHPQRVLTPPRRVLPAWVGNSSL